MTTHECDPDPDPRGGTVTYSRVLRLLIGVLKNDGGWLSDFSEIVTAATVEDIEQSGVCCLKCTLALIGTMAGIATASMQAHNPDILMAYELELAAIEAGAQKPPPD